MKNISTLKRLPLLCCLFLFAPVIYHAQKPELVVRTGHYMAVHSIIFSPDGKTFASSGGDGTIKLWDGMTGLELRSIQAYADAFVTSVVFTHDGKQLISGGNNGLIDFWDIRTGRNLRTLKAHCAVTKNQLNLDVLSCEPIEAIALSPNGKLLASASWDKSVKIFDVDSGREINKLEGHSDWVNSVAFSPDGKYLVSAGADSHINVWDAATGKLIKPLIEHAKVHAVVFSPNGKLIATASDDNTVKLWSMETGKTVTTFSGHTNISLGTARSGSASLGRRKRMCATASTLCPMISAMREICRRVVRRACWT